MLIKSVKRSVARAASEPYLQDVAQLWQLLLIKMCAENYSLKTSGRVLYNKGVLEYNSLRDSFMETSVI